MQAAKVSERGGEVSCSVEETNRIRASLGLAPLRTKAAASAPAPAPASSAGEISLSVAETNALRESLGLKPLRVGAASSEAPAEGSSRNPVAVKPTTGVPSSAASVQARVEEARARREAAKRDAAFSGPSLGQSLLAAGGGSAADWLAGARARSARQAAAGPAGGSKSAQTRRGGGRAGGVGTSAHDEEDDEDEEEGQLLIGHDADTFKEGQEAVLTLRDTTLLDGRGRTLAAAEDVAEEEGAVSARAAAERKERAAKAKRPVYDPFAAGGEEGDVLGHYDDYEGIDPAIDGGVAGGARRGAGLAVRADGSTVDLKDAEAVRRRLELARQGVVEQSASTSAGVSFAGGRAVIDAGRDVMPAAEAAAMAAEEAAAEAARRRRRARRAAKARRRDRASGLDDDDDDGGGGDAAGAGGAAAPGAKRPRTAGAAAAGGSDPGLVA